MRYEELQPVGRAELLRLVADAEAAEEVVVRALLGMVLHEEDGEWAEARCLEALHHGRLAVRRAAAQGLGHVARRHGLVDPKRVVWELSSQGEEMGGAGEDALDDISIFCRRAGFGN